MKQKKLYHDILRASVFPIKLQRNVSESLSMIVKALSSLCIALILFSCNGNNKPSNHEHEMLYTCPMPSDSFFSDKPGKCPKCGMTLIKVENENVALVNSVSKDSLIYKSGYTCPMHPNIHSEITGTCPICGMQLENVKSPLAPKAVPLEVLLKPSNQRVVASVPMVHMMEREENIEMDAYGFITYDTRQSGLIASKVSGRIEKLYVKYRYQKISKGQRVMDIYSPELVTAQQNFLFLLKNDPGNTSLINASKQKLQLLGMSASQIETVAHAGKSIYTVTVYSNFTGHIHEAGMAEGNANDAETAMPDFSLTTPPLSLKEGAYLQKGQAIFSVFNPGRAWAVLNIFAGQAVSVHVGDKVLITPETNPEKDFSASINYVEPFYRQGSKTLTARVYFDNSTLKIPIGSQVKASVFAGNRSADWLPEEAVLSLGIDRVVFVREGESFVARKIATGIINKHLVQVLSGLDKTEAVAANAQYLVDSESFIKTQQE